MIWTEIRAAVDSVGSIDLPAQDRQVAELLVKAASGTDVERELVALFRTRA